MQYGVAIFRQEFSQPRFGLCSGYNLDLRQNARHPILRKPPEGAVIQDDRLNVSGRRAE
jgi:hypothetical protein